MTRTHSRVQGIGLLAQPSDSGSYRSVLDSNGANQEKIVSFCAELVKAKKEQAPLIPDKIASAFTVVDVTGDGNCLFRAISRARGPNENLHENYRLMAAGQVARTYDIATICAATSVQYVNQIAYFKVMSIPARSAQETNRCGGSLELLGFAQRFGITINVYMPDGNPIAANPGKGEVINLFYVNGNHYKVLVPKAS